VLGLWGCRPIDRGREGRLVPGLRSLRTGQADFPHPALQLMVLPLRGLTGQGMGCRQVEQPALGKVGVGPAVVVLSASISLRPFAPRALPRFLARMDALTPERPALCALMRGIELRTGLLASCIKPSERSASNHLSPPLRFGLVLSQSLPRDLSIASHSRDRSVLGLRLYLAGSPRQPAESSSSSCGPVIHLQSLHPLSRGDSYFRLRSSDPASTRTFTLPI
jgi:hypothetical protein